VKIGNACRRGLGLASFIKLLVVSSLLAFVPLLRSAHATAVTSTLTVTSEDTSGSTITGYYTVLFNSGGNIVDTGFTPVSFTVTVGQTYTVLVDDYGTFQFVRWSDGGTDRYRDTGMITTDQAITAVYADITAIPAGDSQISVGTGDSFGEISGYYTTLWQNCQDQTQWQNCVMVDECFSPCTFFVTNGQEYQVAVADYGNAYFAHWSDGPLDIARFHDLTVPTTTTTISLTAVYLVLP